MACYRNSFCLEEITNSYACLYVNSVLSTLVDIFSESEGLARYDRHCSQRILIGNIVASTENFKIYYINSFRIT
jgi:hypothetical protein